MPRPAQQRLPWAPPPAPTDECSVALCEHNRLVGFWPNPPTRGEVRECNGTQVRRVRSGPEFDRLLRESCPFGCIPPPPLYARLSGKARDDHVREVLARIGDSPGRIRIEDIGLRCKTTKSGEEATSTYDDCFRRAADPEDTQDHHQEAQMALYVSGKQARDPAEEGLHNAVCVDVHDLGEVESTFKGKTRMVHKVLIAWEIDKTDKKTGEPQVAYRRFTASIGSKSNLYKFLNTWRGKKFTDEEMQQFDLEKLMGAPCQLQIVHFHPDDGSGPYANVDAALPLAKGQEKLKPSGKYVRVKDREDEPTKPATPAAVDADDDLPF